MSKKITLIVDNILTPYIISRYNEINHVLNGNLEVWFQSQSDINRHWKSYPKIYFRYRFLDDKPIRLVGHDLHTFHINFSIASDLYNMKDKLEKIILCGWDSYSYWRCVQFCISNNIPYTLWSGSTEYEQSWRRTFFMPIIKWVVRNATDYIAYGTRAQHFLKKLGAPAKNIRIFYNSVDLDFFSSARTISNIQRNTLRRAFGIPQSAFVFTYIGQLIPRKGILDLLAAFSRLKHIHPNSHLLIVGNGLHESDIKAAQHSHIKRLHYAPHIQYEDLPKLYNISDCLVLPSLEEVWGLVVNEAMAAGVPVIVSDVVGAGVDLVRYEKTGYTFKAGDVKDLYTSMDKMIQSGNTMKRAVVGEVQKTHPKIMAEKVFGLQKL